LTFLYNLGAQRLAFNERELPSYEATNDEGKIEKFEKFALNIPFLTKLFGFVLTLGRFVSYFTRALDGKLEFLEYLNRTVYEMQKSIKNNNNNIIQKRNKNKLISNGTKTIVVGSVLIATLIWYLKRRR